MDAELYKLVRQAVSDGLTSATWLLILTSVVAAAIGSLFGSYLKKKGENLATKEDFEEFLNQLTKQTKVTEKIKGEVAEQTGRSIESLKAELAANLERLKGSIGISIEERKAMLGAAADELAYVREHYAGIKEYSSAQAEALRQAYLALFEGPGASRLSTDGVESIIENILAPVRRHIGAVDELTPKRIYAVANFLRGFKGRENDLKQRKIAFWEITEGARRFVKADRIAFRLGLINRIIKEVKVMRVRVLQENVVIIGNYTYPSKGTEIEISEDEWMSEDVQRFVREHKIEAIPTAGEDQPSKN